MTKYVYLAWQDQSTRSWHVIGRLSRTSNGYEFRYTQGVNKIPSFSALPNMPDKEKIYHSPELFALFKNRLMPKSRPDYHNYMTWLGIENEELDELEVLAISSGEKETDFFRIIPVPHKNINNDFSLKFFVHGMRHMDKPTQDRAFALEKNERLYLMHDFQNEFDSYALSLRTNDPKYMIGYVPTFFSKILLSLKNYDQIKINVTKVNKDAPIQLGLLCEMSSPFFDKPWEECEEEFKLITE